jgi:hypothetical protein
MRYLVDGEDTKKSKCNALLFFPKMCADFIVTFE